MEAGEEGVHQVVAVGQEEEVGRVVVVVVHWVVVELMVETATKVLVAKVAMEGKEGGLEMEGREEKGGLVAMGPGHQGAGLDQ